MGGKQQPWGSEWEARLLGAAQYQPYWLGQKVELAWISWSGRVRVVWEHSPEQDFSLWKKKKRESSVIYMLRRYHHGRRISTDYILGVGIQDFLQFSP